MAIRLASNLLLDSMLSLVYAFPTTVFPSQRYNPESVFPSVGGALAETYLESAQAIAAGLSIPKITCLFLSEVCYVKSF